MAAPPSSSSSVPRLALGSQGLRVSAQGFGCMSLSPFNAPPKPEQEMIALLHHVVRSGVTFLDTSDIYGPHTNEILIGKALKGIRDEVQLATKFGTFIKDGRRFARGDPEYVRASCEASLKRLDVDCIDLYYLHRVDTRVPIEITVGEMKKLVEEGKVKYLGLSEVSASTIRRAHAVHPITAVQLEWSLWSRDVEEEIVPACRELGIGIVPYSPLGRGFLSAGAKLLEHLPDNDWRKLIHARFQAGNVEKNDVLFQNLSSYAARKGCTPGQLALAWVQHQGEDVAPIPGTSKMKNFEENVGALSVKLRKEELQEIGEDIFPWSAVVGERYPDTNFTHLNSLTPPLSSWTGVQEYHVI